MWVCATAAPIVLAVGMAFGGNALHSAWLRGLALWCVLPVYVWRPDQRACRSGAAADAVNIAIVRYEVSADRPASTIEAAGRWAQEMARVKRIRTAPAWIREMRRRYLLRILVWISPVLVALLLAPAAATLHRPLAQYWGAVQVYLLLLFLLLNALLVWRSKLLKAFLILSQAIGRYEYESAATEADLTEAGRRASGMLTGRAGGA
jgi:hypothetical protein